MATFSMVSLASRFFLSIPCLLDETIAVSTILRHPHSQDKRHFAMLSLQPCHWFYGNHPHLSLRHDGLDTVESMAQLQVWDCKMAVCCCCCASSLVSTTRDSSSSRCFRRTSLQQLLMVLRMTTLASRFYDDSMP